MFKGDHVESEGWKIALDVAGERDSICFVSHAHSDHTAALRTKHRRILTSDETVALFGEANGHERIEKLHGLRFELLPAGHMLGSRQLFIEGDGGAFCYTGDFKLDESLTAEKAVVKQCDELLIEATFGAPGIKFPGRGEVYEDIAKWAKERYERGEIVLLGGYSRGKAQELIALLNKFAGIVPVVHQEVERHSQTYEKFGVKLQRIPVGSSEGEEALRHPFVAVLPFHEVHYGLAVKLARLYHRSVHTAVATGWAMSMRFACDAAFPLSDHADFGSILRYVEEAQPKKIYCSLGEDEQLARALRARGHNAIVIGGPQTRISEW